LKKGVISVSAASKKGVFTAAHTYTEALWKCPLRARVKKIDWVKMRIEHVMEERLVKLKREELSSIKHSVCESYSEARISVSLSLLLPKYTNTTADIKYVN
jgi:hypothetical protein